MFVEEKEKICNEWNKSFDKSNNIKSRKVCYHNGYGITRTAD